MYLLESNQFLPYLLLVNTAEQTSYPAEVESKRIMEEVKDLFI